MTTSVARCVATEVARRHAHPVHSAASTCRASGSPPSSSAAATGYATAAQGDAATGLQLRQPHATPLSRHVQVHSLGEKCVGVLVGHGRQKEDGPLHGRALVVDEVGVVVWPTRRRGNALLRTGHQGVAHAQHLVNVEADVVTVPHLAEQSLVRPDNQNRSRGNGLLLRARVHQTELGGDHLAGIRHHREADPDLLLEVGDDVCGPPLLIVQRAGGEGRDSGASHLQADRQDRQGTDLCRADWREGLRVVAEHHPLALDVLVEVDGALGAVCHEVWHLVPQTEDAIRGGDLRRH
mmetsp:Transcript_2892/g.8193  ORF Transcript_2892/g.8193 Transcript_2892/m.8193 type:complete len:294 (-) Transcript_2892:1068-1949(-)